MDFLQVEWHDGSNFNLNLTKEEFFYKQIFDAIKTNVARRTLPFFNDRADSVPIELTTGKIINDENLIALEQIGAKKGYKSNIWIYGHTLEKLQHEGIRLNFKQDTEPVLCLTKYANSTHLYEKELYIAESGNKTEAQYLYNYDSLDDRSKNEIDRYFAKARTSGKNYSSENLHNLIENIGNKKYRSHQLKMITENLKSTTENISKTYRKYTGSEINLSPVINAQAKHLFQTMTGAKIKSGLSQKNEDICYQTLTKVIEDVNKSGTAEWKMGKSLTKALNAGTNYAKSCTSKDFNLEIRKIHEENNHKKENLNKYNFRTDIEY